MPERAEIQRLCQSLDCSPHAKLLDLQDLIHERVLGEVVRKLACTNQQKEQVKKLVDLIVKEALHPVFRPMEVYLSGSFKRGTALCYDFDVDLVLKLRMFDHAQMPEYMTRSRAALIDKFGDTISFKRDATHRCLRFELADCQGISVKFDLLFTGDPSDNQCDNPRKFYTPAGSGSVDNMLIQAKDEHKAFHVLVLVTKHWKNQFPGTGILTSYYLELFCLRSVKRRTAASQVSIYDAFKNLLVDFIDGPLAVENPNPYAPKELSPGKTTGIEFQAYARKTLERCYNLQHVSACLGGKSCCLADSRSSEAEDCLRQLDVANENRDNEASSEFAVKWQGECRYVALGSYTGQRRGQQCVVKWFKSGRVFESIFWDQDMKAVEKTKELIDAFNLSGVAGVKIRINQPGVWVKRTDGQKVLVEPLIDNFEKFNSNTGYAKQGVDVMHALSHFSYHYTGGKYLLCDLQGGRVGQGFVLTDPVVLSTRREFGSTDLGTDGMENFFYHHVCNRFCKSHWRRSRPQWHFEPQEGSLFSGAALRQRPRSSLFAAPTPEAARHQGPDPVLMFFSAVIFLMFLCGMASDGRRY